MKKIIYYNCELFYQFLQKSIKSAQNGLVRKVGFTNRRNKRQISQNL